MRLPTTGEASGALEGRSQPVSGPSIAAHGAEVVRRIARRVLETATLSRRADDCNSATSNSCDKPVSSNTGTLAIVLGAVIPLCCAIVVMVYLHRRIKRRQRVEDANDPHKSLDFGTGMPIGAPSSKNKRGRGNRKGDNGPEMVITEHDLAREHTRGLSMDMLGSPYMLPPGLHGSRESLRSMSRSVQDEHDPYRPVTWARGGSEDDVKRGSPRFRPENGSVYSAASTLNNTTSEHAALVGNARPMSQSFPVRAASMSPQETMPEGPRPGAAERSMPARRPLPGQAAAVVEESSPAPSPPPKDMEFVQEEIVAVPMPAMPEEDDTAQSHPPRSTSSRKEPPANIVVPPPPSTTHEISQANPHDDAVSAYAEMPAQPQIMEPEEYNDGYDIDPALISTGRFSIDNSAPSQQYPVQNLAENNNRASVMGLRPLPHDNPEENAEQRANRIRSFYREYFDDSKPNPSGGYYEDEEDDGAGFWDGAAVYDPETGAYFFAGDQQRPFAQAPGRRAMTPPPAGARFGPGVHGRAYSTMSGGRRPPGGGNRPGQPMMPVAPKKKLPPPKPLKSLPTPHLLKEDNMLLTSIDFAPPSTFRDAQNGRRPDSPMGNVSRPFSPNVRAYSPLVRASDELSVMPSPHHLRKSGTFTGLDFARLPRFRGQEGMGGSANASDAGSIRSARSGISAMQVDAVRAGAYRVSRIPKEMVTTREDLMSQLRPTMNLTRPA